MLEKMDFIKMLEAMAQERPLRVVVETTSETKMRRSKDIFGTTQHSLTRVDGKDKPIYGLRISVECAEGVWIDVMRYSRLGLQAEAKEAHEKES